MVTGNEKRRVLKTPKEHFQGRVVKTPHEHYQGPKATEEEAETLQTHILNGARKLFTQMFYRAKKHYTRMLCGVQRLNQPSHFS